MTGELTYRPSEGLWPAMPTLRLQLRAAPPRILKAQTRRRFADFGIPYFSAIPERDASFPTYSRRSLRRRLDQTFDHFYRRGPVSEHSRSDSTPTPVGPKPSLHSQPAPKVRRCWGE